MQFAAQAVVWFVGQVGSGAETGRAQRCTHRRTSASVPCARDLQRRTAEVAHQIARAASSIVARMNAGRSS
ncbi:MAG: hypothetical protein M3R63_20945, partial [Actinomycetota bacterium]|nr:hypothetical protein [Actinomycetota bacterium]